MSHDSDDDDRANERELALDDLPEPAFEGTRPIDDLSVDGENPNEMEDDMFDLLVRNLNRRGWLGGPIITNTDGLIADGEHRWRAAQQAGLQEVPVREYNISDDTRRLWRLELNKIRGQHDRKRDALELDHLFSTDKRSDVEELFSATDDSIDDLLDEIRVNTTPQSPGYEYDGEHNVYFMDCIEGMREHLDDDSVDMVFTSPPYNVNLKENYQVNEGDHDKDTYSDDMDPDDFKTLLRDTFTEVERVLKPNGHAFINFQNDIRDGTVKPPTDWLPDLIPLPWRSYIVWNKGTSATINGRLGTYGDGVFAANWEPILHFTQDPRPLHGTGGEQLGVWDIPAANREYDHETGTHPAPFPVALVEKAIKTTTTEGDTILDPFIGSGTTAVAAIQNERDYVGFELDEDGAYQPIVERRIQEATRAINSPENTPTDDTDPDEETA